MGRHAETTEALQELYSSSAGTLHKLCRNFTVAPHELGSNLTVVLQELSRSLTEAPQELSKNFTEALQKFIHKFPPLTTEKREGQNRKVGEPRQLSPAPLRDGRVCKGIFETAEKLFS